MQRLNQHQLINRGEHTNINSFTRSYFNSSEIKTIKRVMRQIYPDHSAAYRKRWFAYYACNPSAFYDLYETVNNVAFQNVTHFQ